MEQLGEDVPLGGRRPHREQKALNGGTGMALALEHSVEVCSQRRVVGAVKSGDCILLSLLRMV